MDFAISFDMDMRAPEFGSNPVELYRAAIDQCEWADDIGFDVIGIGEHHASDDGYLPSPFAFAFAFASTVAAHIATPEQTMKLTQALGPNRTFILTPLLSGLDPDHAWQSLHLFERDIWPYIKDI